MDLAFVIVIGLIGAAAVWWLYDANANDDDEGRWWR